MTTSLRSLARATGIAFAALAFTACSDAPTDASQAAGPRPTTASFDHSKSATGTIDARVLLNKTGNAILDVHTGTFADATNSGTSAGSLTSVSYTVRDGTGKKVASRSVNLNGGTSYTSSLDLCSKSSHDDDHDDSDHDDNDHGRWASCDTRFEREFTVSVSAGLKGLGADGKSSGTAEMDARVLNLPDIDLSMQGLFVVAAGGAQAPATAVAPSTPTTFSVSFPNNKSIDGTANAVGVQTLCVVSVDGLPQLPFPGGQYNTQLNPNAFGYVSSATSSITAGTVSACQFTLSLPAGPHKIVVTAGVTYPGDYDLSNNSTVAFIVNAGAPIVPADLAAQPIERVGNGVNSTLIVGVDTARVGSTVTVRSVIRNPSGQSSAVDCSISANAALKPTAVGVTTNVPVPANGSATCQYTLVAAALGSFPFTITAVPSSASPTDPSIANNLASATLTVVAAGHFSSINVSAMDLRQQWFNAIGAPALPVDSLTLQNVNVSQLALIVASAQDVIGTFTLKGTVINGSTTFPTGTVSGTLHASPSGAGCSELTAGPNAAFPNAPAGFPSQVGYFGEVCAEPATVNGVGGFQKISVAYVQSLAGSINNPDAYLLAGTVQVKIELAFTLRGAATSDKATATITIPVPAPELRSLTNFDGTKVLWTEQNPGPAAAITP